ncbi:MFS transporter [Methanomicrobiaceae archaeon CYW5]|uniref:MFS transporter n=1 Tax=Methanovulcanius yangii TaxID=1789227 RepID=UPI0029CA35B7|nr:MFS transporter [Methanovulcanius yangii]MBT8508133.1 MFS transporter [Methanovulcanius yangii]
MNETRAIFGLSAAHVVTDIYSPVIAAILPLLIVQNNYSYFMAGLIVTVWNLTSSFTQPVFGWLYDARGKAVPVKVTILICAVFISAIGLVQSYWVILLFAVCAALGHALFHPAALGLVSRLAHGPARGRLTSFFVVGGNIGFAVGPIIAGGLVALYGLHGLALMVIPAVLMAFVLHRILPSEQEVAAIPQPPRMVGGDVADQRRMVRAAGILVSGSAFRAWAIFGSVAFLPTFLHQVKGLDIVSANLLVSCMLFAGVLGQVIVGTLSDTYGRKELVLFFTALSIPFFLLFMATSGMLSFVFLIAFGFALWSTFSTTVTMAHELVPGNVGLVSGLMLGLAVGAGGAGVAVSGFYADMTSLAASMQLFVLPVLVALVLFFLVPYPWRRSVSAQRKDI